MTAARMAAEGRDVLRTSSGEPDFDTPSNIRDAAIRSIQAGDTNYTDVAGTSALREAAAVRDRMLVLSQHTRTKIGRCNAKRRPRYKPVLP